MMPLNPEPLELESFEYEVEGACCLSICDGGNVVDYADGVDRYDLLRGCTQVTPDKTGQPTFELIDYVCHGTWTVTADFENINGGMCSSTRDYTFDESSIYVTPVDCCVYYPDIDPSFDQTSEITLDYLDVCETMVEAGVTTYAIPLGQDEAKCQ